nr:MAG: hypothetical protein [Microviridae sp.]
MSVPRGHDLAIHLLTLFLCFLVLKLLLYVFVLIALLIQKCLPVLPLLPPRCSNFPSQAFPFPPKWLTTCSMMETLLCAFISTLLTAVVLMLLTLGICRSLLAVS